MMAAESSSGSPLPAQGLTAAALLPGFPFVRLPPWEVQVPPFEGPLELLLQLLGEGDLEITEVSLARVTDQYLVHIRALAEIDVEAVAGFLAVAAHLLVLKARALVPRQPAIRADAEDAPAEDELVARLRLYQASQQVAATLAQRQAAGYQSHRGIAPTRPDQALSQPLDGATPQQLATALRALLASRRARPRPPDPPLRPLVSLRERVQQVRQRVARQRRLPFRALAPAWAGPAELIVTFLAVLDLWQRGEVLVQQAGLFGDIWLERLPS